MSAYVTFCICSFFR